MKRFNLTTLAVMVLATAFAAHVATAADTAKTITGKSSCAQCSGVTESGHQIMLIDADGMRWVLVGDSDSYKAAHKVRQDEKTMTATLAGDPVVKKDQNGKEYREVKVSDVKVDA